MASFLHRPVYHITISPCCSYFYFTVKQVQRRRQHYSPHVVSAISAMHGVNVTESDIIIISIMQDVGKSQVKRKTVFQQDSLRTNGPIACGVLILVNVFVVALKRIRRVDIKPLPYRIRQVKTAITTNLISVISLSEKLILVTRQIKGYATIKIKFTERIVI